MKYYVNYDSKSTEPSINMELSKFNSDEYQIMTNKQFDNKLDCYNHYLEFNKDKFNDIEKLRILTKSVSEFLIELTNKYKGEELISKIKNCLHNREVNIYSNGSSFNEFYKKMPINKNTIKFCIKPSANYFNDYDIFAYDDRLKSGHRINFDYNVTDEHFKIFFSDNFINDNFDNYVKQRSDSPYNYPQNWFKPNLIISPTQKYHGNIFMSQNEINLMKYCKDNIIYGDFMKYLPLFFRVMKLFYHMGIKKFNITGVDGITDEFKQKHYFEDKFSTIGYDTLIDYFYSNILNFDKYDITIFSDTSQLPNLKKYNNEINLPKSREYVLNNKIDLDKYKFENYQVFYLKIIQHLVDNNIPIVGQKFNDVTKCINFLESQNINVDFENLVFLITKIHLLPDDFNYNFYKIKNKDFKESINNYINLKSD